MLEFNPYFRPSAKQLLENREKQANQAAMELKRQKRAELDEKWKRQHENEKRQHERDMQKLTEIINKHDGKGISREDLIEKMVEILLKHLRSKLEMKMVEQRIYLIDTEALNIFNSQFKIVL